LVEVRACLIKRVRSVAAGIADERKLQITRSAIATTPAGFRDCKNQRRRGSGAATSYNCLHLQDAPFNTLNYGTVMFLIGTIAMVWIVAFLVFYFPGRIAGTKIASVSPNLFYSLLFCVLITKLVVVLVDLVLLFCRFEFLPHFNEDPRGFGLVFVAALLAVPVFSALLLGERRARRSLSGQPSIV
jgi:hypothetical protein